MNYYTSDLHFGHQKTFDRAGRGEVFKDLSEMNEALIRNINLRCKKEDVLYILGDVAAHGVDASCFLRRLNPHLILIVGNHDVSALKDFKFRKCFDAIHGSVCNIKDGMYKLFLCHYPVVEWDGYYRKRFLFYGHIHNANTTGTRLMQQIPTAFNVGVDVNDFMPKTAAEIIGEMPEKMPSWEEKNRRI